MNENGKDVNYEHIIKIDDFLEVKILIPRVLDAMTFRAITLKARKLFNISDEDIGFGEKRTYVKKEGKTIRNGKKSLFSDEMLRELISKRQNEEKNYGTIALELNKSYGTMFSYQQVADKYNNTKFDSKKFISFGGKL